MNTYEHLLSPITILGKTYRNRIGASPVGRLVLDENGDVVPAEIRQFENKAKGGCGVVCVGECFVDDEYSCRENDTPMVFDPNDSVLLEKISRYARAITDNGAVALAELNHCGQSKVGKACDNKTAIGPMSWEQEDGIHNVAMDEAMMEHVADNFAKCAYFMKLAGFDGVVVFCGHGWLLHQFLSPRMNRRQDEYGGSLENRARFPLLVLRRIRERVGRDFIMELRVSGSELVPGGMEVEEVAQFCQMAEKAGLADVIQVSQGIYREPVLSREFSSMFHEPACNSMEGKYIKQRVNLPVSVVGGINSPEIAEQIIADGRCDIVLLGRELFADIDFAAKVERGDADEVNHCVRCFRCFPGPHEDIDPEELDKDGGPGGIPFKECTVNPMYGREETGVGRAHVKKNVLVIGGGVGGMQAAIAAAERGHDVTLLEKTDKLGGILEFCDTDVHKTDLRFFRDQLGRKLQRRGVKVLLNTQAGDDFVARYGPDHVICAVGSHAIVPPIEGIENAMHALEAYRHPEKVGQRVVMIGGGLAGCETGLNLADQGKDVTIIEMLPKLAPDGENLHRAMLLHLLEQKADCRTETRCTKIGRDFVIALDRDGNEQRFDCDTVVYAVGMRSNSDTVENLRKAAGDTPFVCVGDCLKVQQAAQAGYDAYTEAMKI